MKVSIDCGVFVLNTFGRCFSGRIWVRRAWTSSVASQMGRNRAGARASSGAIAKRVSEETTGAFDVTVGRLYFRHWLNESLAALERIAAEPEPAADGAVA